MDVQADEENPDILSDDNGVLFRDSGSGGGAQDMDEPSGSSMLDV